MGIKLGDAFVEIFGKDDKLEKGLAGAEKKTQGWASRVGKGLTGTLSSALGTAAGFIGAQVLTKGFNSVSGAIKETLALAQAEETGIAQLGASVKSTGADWNEASDAIEKYLASELERTALDDGDGRESLSRLTNATGDYRKAIELLPIAQDLARAKGMDLASASEIVGKVAAGNTGILGRYGIELGEGATATEALAVMQGKFGGQAEAYGKTQTGAAQKAAIAMGNIKETIGGKLMPIVGKFQGLFAKALSSPLVARAIDWAAGKLDAFAGGVDRAFGLVTGIIAAFSQNFYSFEEGFNVEGLTTALSALGIPPAVVDTIIRLADGISLAVFAFNEWGGLSVEGISAFLGTILEDVLGFKGAFDTLTGVGETIGKIAAKLRDFVAANPTAVLSGLGAVVAAVVIPAFIGWAAAAIPAAVATLAAIAPIAAVVAGIGLAVGLLVAAWQNDWGGIQTTLTAVWTGTIQPALATLKTWLEVNIPIAIQTLSAFWTNTLLPAIEAVWAFIQTYIIPLFSAIVDVYIAAFKLALTALAGLWQNVLLPALQKAAGFLTDTVIPALTSAWDTIKTKLSPVLETVTGLFDKAKGGLGGLGAKIKEVTDWFAGLAAKVAGFKLPAVLTPGSPTPFENGLTGIGDALVMVTDRFFAFATSVSPERAKTMKDVGGSLKDLAKAIGEVVGSMLKLNATAGPSSGGADLMTKFKAHLGLFEQVGRVAMESVQQIWDEFGYNRIHKLKLTSGRIREIIESVLVDLSGITERKLPDLGMWFGQLKEVFAYAADMVGSAIAKFGAKKLADMAEAAGSIAGIYQVINAGLDSIKSNPDPEWRAAFALLIEQLTYLADLLTTWLSGFTQSMRDALAVAEKNGALVAALWQVLGPDLSQLVPIGDEALFRANAASYILGLGIVAALIVGWLGALAVEVIEAVKRSADVSEAMTKVFAVLGIDLTALIPPPIGFKALFAVFLDALREAALALVPWLRDLRAEFAGTVLPEAAETSSLLKEIFGVLDIAKVFKELASTGVTNVTGWVRKLLAPLNQALDLLMPALDAIKAKYGDALATNAGVVGKISEIFQGISNAVKASKEAIAGGGFDVGGIARIQAQMNQVVTGQVGGGAGMAAQIAEAIAKAIRETGFAIEVKQDGRTYQTISARLGALNQVMIDLGVAGSQRGVFA